MSTDARTKNGRNFICENNIEEEEAKCIRINDLRLEILMQMFVCTVQAAGGCRYFLLMEFWVSVIVSEYCLLFFSAGI